MPNLKNLIKKGKNFKKKVKKAYHKWNEEPQKIWEASGRKGHHFTSMPPERIALYGTAAAPFLGLIAWDNNRVNRFKKKKENIKKNFEKTKWNEQSGEMRIKKSTGGSVGPNGIL